MREITVFLNRRVKIQSNAQTWGVLKIELVENHGFDSNIEGSCNGIDLTKADDPLPMGDITVSLITVDTKHGLK